jgi:hypothetical protein
MIVYYTCLVAIVVVCILGTVECVRQVIEGDFRKFLFRFVVCFGLAVLFAWIGGCDGIHQMLDM